MAREYATFKEFADNASENKARVSSYVELITSASERLQEAEGAVAQSYLTEVETSLSNAQRKIQQLETEIEKQKIKAQEVKVKVLKKLRECGVTPEEASKILDLDMAVVNQYIPKSPVPRLMSQNGVTIMSKSVSEISDEQVKKPKQPSSATNAVFTNQGDQKK